MPLFVALILCEVVGVCVIARTLALMIWEESYFAAAMMGLLLVAYAIMCWQSWPLFTKYVIGGLRHV